MLSIFTALIQSAKWSYPVLKDAMLQGAKMKRARPTFVIFA
jgi:hypothetical protein